MQNVGIFPKGVCCKRNENLNWFNKRNEYSKYSTDQIGLKTSLDKWPSLGQTGSDFAGTILWIFVRLKFLTS